MSNKLALYLARASAATTDKSWRVGEPFAMQACSSTIRSRRQSRIVAEGFGATVMLALERAGWREKDTQVLTATPVGRALYSTLGWNVLSAYCTAELLA